MQQVIADRYITIHSRQADKANVIFINTGGEIVNGPVRMTEHEATTVMNCIAAGYWATALKGLIVSWKFIGRVGNVVERVIFTSDTANPIEYQLVDHREAECMFIIGANHKTGIPFYVGDYLAHNPLVKYFDEASIISFEEVDGRLNILDQGRLIPVKVETAHKSFVNDTVVRFYKQWYNGNDFDIHVIWAKVKG